MRFYRIDITRKSGQPWRPSGFAGLNLNSSFTSYVNGQTIPGAWQVDLDIPISTFALTMGGAFVRVWGVSLADIAQASDLNEATIEVYVGMAPGLPLATAAYRAGQQGLVLQGTIFPAFGNWVGTDMTLDLTVVPPFGSDQDETRLVLNWTAGQALSAAIDGCLATAFPKSAMDIRISPSLVAQQDEKTEGTLVQVNDWLRQRTIAMNKASGGPSTYLGVYISRIGQQFRVFDGSQDAAKTTQILFQDLIGQPTWIDLRTVQIKCVMRGDLSLGDRILMPQQALQTVTPQSFPQFRDRSSFLGEFMVLQQRHVGSSRVPSADSWNTTINAVSLA